MVTLPMDVNEILCTSHFTNILSHLLKLDKWHFCSTIIAVRML